MALTLLNTPGDYYSLHGNLIFTIKDNVKPLDPVTYPDYKYVCDVYVLGALVARLKSIPRPDNKVGIFDIANIVRNYVFINIAPAPSQLRAFETGSGEFYIETQLKFGEEYGFNIYPDIVVDSERVYFNHYNGRLLGQETILPDYLDKVLSVRPYATPVFRNAKFCFIPFLPTDDTIVNLIIKSYNGGGLVGTITVGYTPSGSNIMQLFNVSPDAINANTPGFISSFIAYYTVEFNTTNITDDSIYRFNLVCEPKYEVFTLHFANRFSGFESREFTKVSRKSIAIERSEYTQQGYTMDSSGSIHYTNSANVYHESRTVFAATWKEKLTLNTDILTDAEYRWLGDLILSPLILIEVDGYFIPVFMTANDYEFKKNINDDLTNLTISIEYGDKLNTQYR